ncbi:MAG TPA: RNA 2',3'-cyclic phosphodiesterase [Alphaproteobacteria bacterium]|jgi:2'-5' RNA ligase|nr:RNA 2',3'-cyclic phosphodiesterase [Alphaproteobacteria bacterium]
MIRLFCALELPQSIRDRLIAIGGGLPGARWVPEENMHLTLRFIGEVPESSFDDIATALAGVRAPAFDLTIAGVGHFERGRKPTMLWAAVESNPALNQLQTSIEAALRRAGVKSEDRRFQPHITLARLDDTVSRDRVAAFLGANGLLRAAPFRVEQFVLFSSILGRSGPTYHAEVEFPLNGALGFAVER